MFKQLRIATTTLFALAATAAGAQSAPATGAAPAGADVESEGLATIIVTATKQATPLQTTPIAITAVTAEQLQQRSIETASDLGAIVPNATFREAQGAFGPGVTAFIRGIGQGDTNLASEPGVAFYVDDVYYPLVFGSNFDLLDLDHVEVLRGPQGTLFGRNALAGAVNMVGKQPILGQTSALGEITAGDYNHLDVRVGINLPLGDNAALRLSGYAKKQQGYEDRLDFRCQMIKNGTPQLAGSFGFSEGLLIDSANFTPSNCVVGHLGGDDSHAARGQLLWVPAANLSVTVTGDYMASNDENVADQLLAVNATTANNNANLRAVTGAYTVAGGPTFAYDNRFVTGSPYSTYATFGDPTPAGATIAGSSFYNGAVTRGGLRYPATSPTKNYGASAKVVYDFTDSLHLTLIGGYRNYDTRFSFDVDGSPIALENTRNNSGEHDTTAEARLAGKNNWLDWVGGVFYYGGAGYVHAVLVSPYLGLMRYQNNIYTPKSEAAYVNLNIHPLNKVTLTVGTRYSDDKKEVAYSNLQDGVPAGNIIFNVTPKDSRFDWKAGASYQLNDLSMVYASAATGFRLPSFNSRPLQPDQVQQVAGDQTLAYELGLKTDLFDRKLRFNGDVFYTDYQVRPTGVSGQEYAIGPDGNPVPGAQMTVPLTAGPAGSTTCVNLTPAQIAAGTPGYQCIGRTFYANTPGKIKGVEAEVEAAPIDHLSLDASMGYSKFNSADLDSPARVNHQLPGVPNWTASAGAQYEVPVSALRGSLTPRMDWLYQGSIVYSAVSTTYNQPAYGVVNGRLTWNNKSHDLSVALAATNMFDKFYYRNFFIYQELGYPNVNAQPAPPREWFVTVRKDF